MNYIVHKRYRGLAANGQTVNLKRGTVLRTDESALAARLNPHAMLYTDEGVPVATPHSDVGKAHIAYDQDSRGLERGDLTRAIAFGPRKGSGTGARFTDEEIEMLERTWHRWLIPDVDVILFNDAFYAAEPRELRELAKALNIRVA